MPDPIPALLPTTVIGSYSLPKWLEQARESHTAGKLTDAELGEAHDNAVKSCLKDQELAGVDVVTDGELRRETMIYFFNRHIKGFRLYGPMKPIGTLDPSIQMPDPVVESRVARGDMPLVAHWRFAQAHSTRLVKVCVTGPHMLAKRAHNEAYRSDRELTFDLAAVLNAELRDLVTAGCPFIQVDEPVWVGYPEEVRAWAVEAFNRTVEGLAPAKNPEEAAKILVEMFPKAGALELNLQQWKDTVQLMYTANTKGKPAGWMAKEDWDTLLGLQKTYGQIQTRAAGDYYTDEFFDCK